MMRFLVTFFVICSFLIPLRPTLAEVDEIGNYEIKSVPQVDLDRYIPIGNDKTNTPENLQGLWWMDGNPLADKIVSFASAKFKPIKDADGNVTAYTTTLSVYDEGVWTWDDSPKGRLLYSLVNRIKLTYFGRYDKNFTHGDITPIVTPIPAGFPVPIIQSMLVDFTMTKVGPDEWRRDSILLGKPFVYRFRRIVDGHGKRLPAYDEFVKKIEKDGPENAIIPYRKN